MIYSVLGRVPVASMWRLVGFESLYDGSGDGDVNEFSDDAFIVDTCWRLVVYLSSTKGMKFCVPLFSPFIKSIGGDKNPPGMEGPLKGRFISN